MDWIVKGRLILARAVDKLLKCELAARSTRRPTPCLFWLTNSVASVPLSR